VAVGYLEVFGSWEWEVLENEGRMSGSMVPGLVWDSRRERKKNIFAATFGFSTSFQNQEFQNNEKKKFCEVRNE
jgi:hypothetical protein